MKNILYLFSTADTSVAKVALNQINALRKYYPDLNIKIACVNYYPEGSLIEDEIFFYKKKYCYNQILNYFKSIFFVRKVKCSFKPDITISNLGAVNAYNALLGKEIKIGIFHAPMIQFNQKNIISKSLNFLALRLLYQKLDGIIGISQEVVNDLKVHKVNDDIQLEYNIHDFDQIDKIKDELIDENLFGTKRQREILCLGMIDRNKRQDLIIKSLCSLDDTILYIVGKVLDENYYNELLNLIEVLGIIERVRFIPFMNNPYPLIQRVDVLISSSISEGLPGVIIESLYLNTPVLCTNSSLGIWEIFNKKEIYNSKLNNVEFCEKGIIIPNPNHITEDLMIKIIVNTISYIYRNNRYYKINEFFFSEKISENNIISFYNFLKKKYNENSN
ncbi:glycosyltransferase [Flavobacterium columnare]|uniref:Glycosyltransferase n=1 Tax=Flavobacterium columnare TaxID=996 RepID=A0A437UDT8_9FLAO|nr:glycosyltransferase [Flavobacterium columnare]RVU91800.1 glycosyltransferase [Flavobacterium columnare]